MPKLTEGIFSMRRPQYTTAPRTTAPGTAFAPSTTGEASDVRKIRRVLACPRRQLSGRPRLGRLPGSDRLVAGEEVLSVELSRLPPRELLVDGCRRRHRTLLLPGAARGRVR